MSAATWATRPLLIGICADGSMYYGDKLALRTVDALIVGGASSDDVARKMIGELCTQVGHTWILRGYEDNGGPGGPTFDFGKLGRDLEEAYTRYAESTGE